ncbi:MAG: ferrochelatase [Burkholderiales bacterium]|jgi:ferrochelatase|nr:ferrochelatase [Burkholderiales bacterium]
MSFFVPRSIPSASKIGVLLVNLGTPDAPTPLYVSRYLRAFLGDRRVIELPRALWWPILYGVILPFRSPRSAEKYQKIWTDQGSPLLIHTQNQCAALQKRFHADAAKASFKEGDILVKCAMRYGNPSIPLALDALLDEGVTELIVLPLYPQYSSGTSGSVFDAVSRYFLRTRNVPAMKTIHHFYDHPAYINALARHVDAFWQKNGRPEHLLISFHGAPHQSIADGDPYYPSCVKTAEYLTRALSLSDDFWTLSFQSRFGKTRWLEPYTTEVLAKFAAEKKQRVDVVCPSFVSDCLETLEEIAMTERGQFIRQGGGELCVIPSLNDSPAFIDALYEIIQRSAKNVPFFAESLIPDL